MDFSIKSAWLGISRMYNQLGVNLDLGSAKGFVLLNIDPDNGTPSTKIAPLIGMEARSLSRILKTLEVEGLVTREADLSDKRVTRIQLTTKGHKQREISRQAVRTLQTQLEARCSEKDLEAFFRVISAVEDTLKDTESLLAAFHERMKAKKLSDML